MSQVTKRALAASLIKLLSQKPLDKVTVKDIICLLYTSDAADEL